MHSSSTQSFSTAAEQQHEVWSLHVCMCARLGGGGGDGLRTGMLPNMSVEPAPLLTNRTLGRKTETEARTYRHC